MSGVPELSLLNYFSILKAGVSVDDKFLALIGFENVIKKSDLSRKGELDLNNFLNIIKNLRDQNNDGIGCDL